jgi:pimeloyl-ACP methyl ester carboxylesterase
MSHLYRHRSPFQQRAIAVPPTAPVVIVDGPSPLGAAASTFIALGLLGAAGSVHVTTVADLRPKDLRSRRLPTLGELAGALAERSAAWPTFDVVGVGLGAIVALRLALDGGRVRRIVAVDAPVPSYRASEVLATERYFGDIPRRGLSAGERAMIDLDMAGSGGALPEGMDPTWFRPRVQPAPLCWRRESLPAIADTALARVEQPVLCINSPKSAIVTGGDHVARLVPTSRLLRLRTMDTADEAEQTRVADALADFLHAVEPQGPAYCAADDRAAVDHPVDLPVPVR